MTLSPSRLVDYVTKFDGNDRTGDGSRAEDDVPTSRARYIPGGECGRADLRMASRLRAAGSMVGPRRAKLAGRAAARRL